MCRRLRLSISVFIIIGLFTFGVFAAEDERALFAKFDSTSDMTVYRSFESYSQAPILQKMVEEGQLPPVEERLPQEPAVWKTNIMVDGMGDYGGVMRRTYGSTTEGYNIAAGQTSGWGGTVSFKVEGLIRDGPMWMLKSPEPLPNLAKSWEWSEDGKTLTMHLMEGVKWSDGVEFTAEDLRFTYEDCILDSHIPAWASRGSWEFGEKITELEVVDDYTVKWHFGKGFPVRAFFLMDSRLSLPITPAHIYKYYHPKYNEEMTYEDFLQSGKPENVPDVVLGPYVPVAYKPGQQLVYVRNPYYWRVDEEGRQLPYFDEIIFTKGESWQQRTLNLLAGSCDLTHVQKPDLQPLVLAAAQNPQSHFTTSWGAATVADVIRFNFSLYKGVDNPRDEALRLLFRKKKFRQAVSHLVNRKGITQGLFPMESVRPFHGGPFPSGYPVYDEANIVKYPYDPDKASSLLTELGFEDTDGDGILNWPQNSLIAGKELIIEVTTVATEEERAAIAEALIPEFREAGMDLRLKNLKGAVYSSKIDSGNWEMTVGRIAGSTPLTNPDASGPVTLESPYWHEAGPGGKRSLLPFEKEIGELLRSSMTMTDAQKRRETFGKVQKIFTENVYSVGVFEIKYLDAFAKRHRNYPSDFPVILYKWTESNVPISTRWTPKNLQLGTKFNDLIPGENAYTSQDWYEEAYSWYKKMS